MKTLLKYCLALSLVAFGFSCACDCVSAADNATGIKRVVLIGVDGGGAFFKDADTPNLDRIFKDGAVTYDCLTSKPTISAECWGAMLHGVTPEYHGLTNGIAAARPYPVDSPFPSVFRVIRENMPNAKLASIVHWNQINHGIIENNLDVYKARDEKDSVVCDMVCDYLEKNDPTMLFVHFDECDGVGHRSGYGQKQHLEQLHITDGYIQRIHEVIEKRGWVDSTLFIVTADHGGKPEGGAGTTGHGGWSDAEKYIMFAAAGPNVEHGAIGEMGVRDTASIVLYALGLADKQPKSWTSRVPSGVFKGVEAKERPVYVNENIAAIKRVVLVGVDGGGIFFKDADTPNIDRIFKTGSVSYDVITSKPTISAQSWGSMLHGVTPEFHGLTNGIAGSRPYPEDSPFPSVFRAIRENMPNATLASICHWNPINIGIIENNLGVVKEHGNSDAKVTDMVCDYIAKNDPTFLFVHFDDCDGAGHGHGYGSKEHLAQLHTTDGYVQRIYEAIEKRGWLDSTLFILSADHGGTPQGSHGGWTDAEKYIIFAATGPGVIKGSVGEMGVRDISSVVLYALGLGDKQPETWTSRVPHGLFKGAPNMERPQYVLKPAFAHREHATTATPTGDDSIPAILGKERVRAYFAFDGDAKDALGKVETTTHGKLYFVDGYFGKAASFDDGYVTVANMKPGKSSFSVAFWMKTPGVDDDPCIISNKNWNDGRGPGFVISLRAADTKFNVGNKLERMDYVAQLPFDYTTGWVYVVYVVDRENNLVKYSYDFSPFDDDGIPGSLKSADFSVGDSVNIGQDGTGKYRAPLSATLDEVLIIDGVLTDEDVAKLKKAYQAR